MFIYEKNKLNKETGVVEQSLNVTFEGNKPVETPDVVITKDGVTGIKSDSKAYVENTTTFYTGEGAYNLENNGIGDLSWSYSLVGRYFTSFSVNGEIIINSENNMERITLKECDYVGIGVDGTTSYNQINIIGAFPKTYGSYYTYELATISADLTNGGELIINMRTGEVSFNGTTATISEPERYLNAGATIFVTLSSGT